MSTYQIRDAQGGVLAEDTFETFDDANVWATEQEAEPGWTMFQQIGGEWVPARHDPLPD